MYPLFSIIRKTTYKSYRSESGFSLIEMAIVLAIIATIINFSLPIWSQFQATQRLHQTQKNIQFINQVLGQYFVTYKSLPCPVLKGHHVPNDHGLAPLTCLNNSQVTGTIPYRTLGISYIQTLDGNKYPIQYTVDSYLTERDSYKNLTNNYENKIHLKLEHDQDAVVGCNNPIIYILVATNDAHPPISLPEKTNVDQSLTFYDLPYSVSTAKPFRHTISWTTINTLIACHGQGLLKITPLTKQTKPPIQITDQDAPGRELLQQLSQQMNAGSSPLYNKPTIRSDNQANVGMISNSTANDEPEMFSSASYE